MKAKSNGFELTFTQPVSKKTAEDVTQYAIDGFTYTYHKKYGSPIVDQRSCSVLKAEVSPDGFSVRLYVNGLREGYVHQLTIGNIKSSKGESLLHNTAYYTLNTIPTATAQDKEMMNGLQQHQHHDMGSAAKGTGCGANPSKNVTTQPAGWKAADIVIQVGTKPGLKFDLENFTVPEGSKVKLIFNNNDDMLHNLVITKPGKGEAVGKKALDMGLKGSQFGYVPESDDVLFNTCILQPDASQAIYFIAPKVGAYSYICSFPGHFYAMKGIMKVVLKKK
jgi:azurin